MGMSAKGKSIFWQRWFDPTSASYHHSAVIWSFRIASNGIAAAKRELLGNVPRRDPDPECR